MKSKYEKDFNGYLFLDAEKNLMTDVGGNVVFDQDYLPFGGDLPKQVKMKLLLLGCIIMVLVTMIREWVGLLRKIHIKVIYLIRKVRICTFMSEQPFDIY